MDRPDESVTPPEFFSEQVRTARRFYLDLSPSPAAPLTVVCGGCELCEPDYGIQRSTFPYHSIEFVARGHGSLVLGGQSHRLVAGTVFAYGPGISQEIATSPDDPLLKYFVDFTGTRAEEMLHSNALPPGTVGRVLTPGEIQTVWDTLIRDGLRATATAAGLCAALLNYLVLKIAETRVPGQGGQSRAFSTYQRCRQYIAEHCEQLQSLEQISIECRVDRAYLCRLFRRYDDETPYRVLMRLKMNQAADRLQSPDILVKQVAAELGFDDPYHFSRAFKAVFGISPDAFRRLR